MAEIPVLFLIAAIAGAGLNVARGALNQPKEDFSIRLATGGLIAAAVGALAATAVFDFSTITGVAETVVLGILAGFSSDFAFSKLKK